MSAHPGFAPDAAGPLALTMGDPSGIAAEISAASWRILAEEGGPVFFLIADPDAVAAAGAPVRRIAAPAEARAAFGAALPVLPEPLSTRPEPGRPAPENAASVVRSIERAVALTRAGEASAVVTNPINKRALYEGAGFAHPGHTEFLAALGGVERSVMMLASPALRVVPVTIHVALAEAVRQLSAGLIEETIRIAHRALISDFGIAAPRIAVSGLNPHAGEGGAMGREEIEIIGPALDRLRGEGLAIRGPLPADTMFHPAARAGYDVAVCMTHDQALIPIKTLDFDRGVNVTLGLPFIRTSPDHGVAYDIAGKGVASPTSLVEALRLAGSLAERRRAA